jgi:hypothetical protein
MQNNNKVEMRATTRFVSGVVGSVNRGDRFTVSRAMAEHFIKNNVAELVQAAPGPKEQKPAGPQETKQKEGGADAPKKSSGAPTDGRLIGTHSLSALGQVALSSFSAAGQALRQATASRVSRARAWISSVGRSGRSR